MCEFTVILDGKTVFKDVVHAKVDNNDVIARDVLGESRAFRNCRITEVDVNSTHLLLFSTSK